jgi:hypothetical protein
MRIWDAPISRESWHHSKYQKSNSFSFWQALKAIVRLLLKGPFPYSAIKEQSWSCLEALKFVAQPHICTYACFSVPWFPLSLPEMIVLHLSFLIEKEDDPLETISGTRAVECLTYLVSCGGHRHDIHNKIEQGWRILDAPKFNIYWPKTIRPVLLHFTNLKGAHKSPTLEIILWIYLTEAQRCMIDGT